MITSYLRELVKHTINVYSGASFLLGLSAMVFLNFDQFKMTLIITSIAFLSSIIAGFYTWQEAYNKHPKAANLSIEYKSCFFGENSSRRGVPLSPMRFLIKLDAINYGQEPAVLTGIKVVKFNMNNKLLMDSPCKTEVLLSNTPHGSSQITYPYTIAGGQRLPNMEYRINVNLVREMEPIEFACSLGEFKNYEIELEYSFEDMNRTINPRRILIQESFENYRQGRIKEWSRNEPLYGLAIEALRASGIIE